MKRFGMAQALIASALLLLLAPAPLLAQIAGQTLVVGTCGTQTYVAGKMRYPTQDTTGKACTSGGGSGSLSVNASTNPTPVTAGAQPLNEGLFSNLFVTPVTPAGAQVDLSLPSAVKGSIASGSAATDPPVVTGGRASTTVPTPVADGQAVAARLSKVGNTVTSTWAPRDLQADNGGYTATSTTSAVDCVTAGASGIFRDIVSITANNSSATDTVIQILDTDGTTVRWTGTAKANDMRGISFPQPLKEVAAAASWKCKTVTSVASVVFTIQYFETK